MTDCHHPVTSTAEAEIAVGAMTGIAPGQIIRHALLVLDEDGDLHVSTSCCKHELPQLIGRAGLVALEDMLGPGRCEHDQEPRS